MTSRSHGRPPHADDATRTSIGPYRLIEIIGSGGMGTVWLAEQSEPLRRQVALKVVRTDLDGEELLARFDAERRLLALMSHPNIPQVFDVGRTEDGLPYLAMEYVPGLPLTEFCDHRELDVDSRLRLFVDVCRGVHHAHQRGILHRDLKPSNVLVQLVDGKPVPKIIDFGVAKALQPLLAGGAFGERGRFIGTPSYTSPEQADPTALGIDSRTDVYSLGVLLYELLVGETPFDIKSVSSSELADLPRRIREQTPSKPSTRLKTPHDGVPRRAAARATRPGALIRRVRGDLDWITLKALQKDPERRYASASELALDVERHLRGLPVSAAPHVPGYAARKFLRRHRVPVAAAAIVLVALIAALTATIRLYREAQASAEAARASEQSARASEQRATESRELAERNEQDAKRALERTVAAEAEATQSLARERAALTESVGRRLSAQALTIADETPTLALLLAIEGAERAPGADTQAALYRALELHREIAQYDGHDDPPLCIAASPDDSLLVSGDGSGLLLVRDARTGEIVKRLDGHDRAVEACGFTPDGSSVWSAANDKRAIVWDLASGTERQRFEHPAPIAHIRRTALLGDGRSLCTFTDDGVVRAWDIERGGAARVVEQHAGGFADACASADGRRIACIDKDDVVSVFDALDPAPARVRIEFAQLAAQVDAKPALPAHVELSSDGKRLLARSRSGEAVVCDTATGAVIARYVSPGERCGTVTFTRDGRLVFLIWRGGASPAHAEIRDSSNGRLVCALTVAGLAADAEAIFSPDGNVLLTRSHPWSDLWDVATGRYRGKVVGAAHGDHVIRFSSDSRRILAGGHDNLLRVFAVDACREEWSLAGLNSAGQISFSRYSPDGESAIVARRGEDGVSMDLVDARSGRRLCELLPPSSGELESAFDRGGERIVLAADPVGMRMWELSTRAITFERKGTSHTLRFSANGAWLCWRTPQGLDVIDPRSGRVAGTLVEANQRCYTAEPSSDGTRVVTGDSGHNTVSLWDVASGKLLARWAHKGLVFDASFDARGERILSFANDTSARIVDARTFTTLQTYDRLPVASYGRVAWSPDGEHFAIQSETNLMLFDVRSSACIARWKAAGDEFEWRECAFTADGKALLDQRVSSVVRFLPLDPLAYTRALAPRRLTAAEMETYGIGTPAEREARRTELALDVHSALGCVRLAQAALARGDADGALRALERAQGLRATQRIPANYDFQLARARALRARSRAATGDGSAARAADEGAALEALRKAIAGGGLDREDLTLTSEFEALATRPEFVELLATLPE